MFLGEIILLDEEGAVAARGCIQRHAQAGRTSSDH